MNCEHETLNKIMNSNYIWHKIYLFSVGILFNWRLLRNARGVWVVWWLDLFLFHVCLCIHYRVEWVWALVCVWRFACLCFVISIINNMWKQKSDSPTEPNRTESKNPKHHQTFNPPEIVHTHTHNKWTMEQPIFSPLTSRVWTNFRMKASNNLYNLYLQPHENTTETGRKVVLCSAMTTTATKHERRFQR